MYILLMVLFKDAAAVTNLLSMTNKTKNKKDSVENFVYETKLHDHESAGDDAYLARGAVESWPENSI